MTNLRKKQRSGVSVRDVIVVDTSVLAGHENAEVAAYDVDQSVAQHLLSRFVEGVDLASLIDDDARHRQTIHHLPDYTKPLAISTKVGQRKTMMWKVGVTSRCCCKTVLVLSTVSSTFLMTPVNSRRPAETQNDEIQFRRDSHNRRRGWWASGLPSRACSVTER